MDRRLLNAPIKSKLILNSKRRTTKVITPRTWMHLIVTIRSKEFRSRSREMGSERLTKYEGDGGCGGLSLLRASDSSSRRDRRIRMRRPKPVSRWSDAFDLFHEGPRQWIWMKRRSSGLAMNPSCVPKFDGHLLWLLSLLDPTDEPVLRASSRTGLTKTTNIIVWD